MSRTARRQIIAVGVEGFERDQSFCEWPLHLTLVSWFHGAKQSKLLDGLEGVAERTKRVSISVGDRALFGAGCDVPVRLVETSGALQQLHLKTLTAAYQAGADINLEYMGYRYRPHITEQTSAEIPAGFEIGQFALIDAVDTGEKTVAEVFTLHEH